MEGPKLLLDTLKDIAVEAGLYSKVPFITTTTHNLITYAFYTGLITASEFMILKQSFANKAL